MLLVDWQIKEKIQNGCIGVSPFDESQIQPNSLDVKLGNRFSWYTNYREVINPYSEKSVNEGMMSATSDQMEIQQHDFFLAETVERITLPDNVVASIEGKSSLARLGITIHQTGGWIDAGFSGTITLEIANLNPRPVLLCAGMPIGQIVFYETESAEVPYDKKPGAKYQNQTGPVASRFYKNQI